MFCFTHGCPFILADLIYWPPPPPPLLRNTFWGGCRKWRLRVCPEKTLDSVYCVWVAGERGEWSVWSVLLFDWVHDVLCLLQTDERLGQVDYWFLQLLLLLLAVIVASVFPLIYAFCDIWKMAFQIVCSEGCSYRGLRGVQWWVWCFDFHFFLTPWSSFLWKLKSSQEVESSFFL